MKLWANVAQPCISSQLNLLRGSSCGAWKHEMLSKLQTVDCRCSLPSTSGLLHS